MMRCVLRQAERIPGQMQQVPLPRSQARPLVLVAAARDSSIAIMETYPVLSKDKVRSSAFEVENVFIAVSTIAQLLQQVEGVTEVRPRKTLSG